MSYSTLKGFDKNGDAFHLAQFQNGHYPVVIWDRLAKKYGIEEKAKREEAIRMGLSGDPNDWTLEQDRTLGYAARGGLMLNMQPVWDLQHSPDISEDDWWCLMFTFDYAVLLPQHIERVAQAFDNFDTGDPKVVDHGKGFAFYMRKALREVEGLRGVALHCTSVTEDPWTVYIPEKQCQMCGHDMEIEGRESRCTYQTCPGYNEWEEEEPAPYNLDKGSKHWFIPTKEKWQEKVEK